MKTIQQEMHAENIHGRVTNPKPLVSSRNATKGPETCRDPIGQNCNGNKSSGLMNPYSHYSTPPDVVRLK
ncbi:hypothetical protein TNCV_1316111 [Trichonephila clavipes]|nr:hypothetical protein TNCV_1316111 [Trichonephila clavipes]